MTDSERVKILREALEEVTSYLFMACQPGNGDIFSGVDDIIRAALSATEATPPIAEERFTLDDAIAELQRLENEQLRYSDATSVVRAETYGIAIEEIRSLGARPKPTEGPECETVYRGVCRNRWCQKYFYEGTDMPPVLCPECSEGLDVTASATPTPPVRPKPTEGPEE